MARGFLYVYERIYKGETEMQTEFRKIPVNGKRTSVADQKRVRKIISDNTHRIAQECSVLVSYPKMRIEGTAVNLGDVHIMLPDCRIIDIEELKKIERGGEKLVEVYLRTIDGCEKKFIGDIIINDDTVQYIKEDGSGEIIYKKYISELRIEGDCPQVEAMGNVHIQAPWERMTAPRYNEYKVGPKHGW